MTDTDLLGASAEAPADSAAAPSASARRADERRRSGLNGMVLAELRAIAGDMGIRGISGMRKGDLIAAITAQGGAAPAEVAAARARAPRKTTAKDAPRQETVPSEAQVPAEQAVKAESPAAAPAVADAPKADALETDVRKSDAPKTDAPDAGAAAAEASEAGPAEDSNSEPSRSGRDDAGNQRGEGRNQRGRQQQGDRQQGDRQQGDKQDRQQGDKQDRQQGDKQDRQQGEGRNQRRQNGNQNRDNQNRDGGQGGNRDGGNRGDQGGGQRNNQSGDNGPDDEEGRGKRGRRFRERRRGGRDRGGDGGEPQVSEDDVLQPVAGILDVLDNYAFVRTSGYIAGPNDVYVSMNMVRRNGLRRGDAITGAVKLPREGEQQNQRQKFNPLVRLDTVNGLEVDAAKNRPEFNKLTPLYPNQRLRLETAPNILTTRVIDLIMPIGKGQRALISAPPKAGKTTILQDIANAIATNNPECYLMVVLVDERPEEVTDMQRSVRGEVISSTFDRPPSDHTSVAELAIERAKRLVETGRDVVVLLDSITRLGRAYNNSSPASGRILSGGIDSTALYPPKRFLGAARNIENGGSLTIIATALVETGSTGDTVIFEEFKGTGNAELKLDRKISERRVFPAVDVAASNTRKDELIMAPDEATVVNKLRRLLAALDSQQSIELLISQLKKTRTNIEFLMTVQKNSGFADSE
ncbi:transcription termination factor Rho [Tsukamurella sp. 8F]|uniref:transcription termination factor Rho n=1 Tax=unclassified Tsukamurella TaxID=2633480 RepID=UPI0023B98D11|nr:MULTISPECIES: transcription termination factor Rho [unclassified Tsukamurella]MDF0530319.1 transcription termination factor Rho [Tsukamurella sp. 8J]MDF0587616.1 transcription termination factor Rho [Tsukamurella sp. 8F]